MKLQEATNIKIGSTSASKVMLGDTQVWPKQDNNHLFYGEVVDTSRPLPTIQLYNNESNVKTYTPILDTLNNTFYIDDWGTVPTFNTLSMDFLTNKSNIKTITMLKGLANSNVTDMSWMFSECSSLTQLDLSNFDTSNVTTMRNMFSACSSLTQLDLSKFNTSNVTDMVYMFEACSSLTSLYLSNFDTSKVIDMSWMFSECSSLASLDLSNFDMSNVINMSYMFYKCTKLSTLDLSNWNITKISAGVTSMNNMFYFCTNLSDVYINKQNTLNTLTNGLTMAGDPSNDFLYIPDTAIIHYTDEANPSTVIDYYWDGSAWVQ